MVTTLKALRRLEWQVGPIGQNQVRTLKTKSVLRMLFTFCFRAKTARYHKSRHFCSSLSFLLSF